MRVRVRVCVIFQSTPSARRATAVLPLFCRCLAISIHALREESDKSKRTESKAEYVFQSTPSARRATHRLLQGSQGGHDFNPRPPRGGRPGAGFNAISPALFQSTPSARRATRRVQCVRSEDQHFNPRPPRGERLQAGGRHPAERINFNPRPPRGERPFSTGI